MWLPSSIIISAAGPLTSRASRSASAAGTMRSCRPFTMKIGQVMLLGDAVQRQRGRVLARLVQRLAMAAHAEGLARQFRQAVPGRAEIERPAERDAGLDALVESRRARRVIAAQAHAPHADARRVEIAPRRDVVDHRLDRHLIVAADGEIVLRLALAGAVEDERREPRARNGAS